LDDAQGGVVIIMNPSSGPFPKANPDSEAVGYVYTSWGQRVASAVKADIDLYYEPYPVDGILFDETATRT